MRPRGLTKGTKRGRRGWENGHRLHIARPATSLDRASPLFQETMISESFSKLSGAENDDGGARVRAYVADELVLAVTEHEPARPTPHTDPGSERSREPDDAALQRRTTVEAVTGGHVAATLSGHIADPEVSFELFVLA